MSTDLSGAQWFKSSRSTADQECVEVAHLGGGRVGVRDSKNPTGPTLVFASDDWDTFLAGARNSEFDET